MSARKDVVQKYIEGFRRIEEGGAVVAIGNGSAAKKGAPKSMPFDVKRMVCGGFKVLVGG